MKHIVESMGVKIHCPIDGRFAFFNSPYPAHKENAGLDIYPNVDFGGLAPCPVDGEVMLVRRIKSPAGGGFEASDHDTVILIENADNPETVTKLLHLDPIVKVGDIVNTGDPIGFTLRSGYYGWGTSPHIHLELRSPLDPLRARGGYNLELKDAAKSEVIDEISGLVVHLQSEFALIQLETKSLGLGCIVNGEPATLDGGIPYYGWLGSHILNAPNSGVVEIVKKPIADVIQGFKKSCKAKCRDFRFSLNGKPLLGLSLTLWPNLKPLIKLIPLKRNDFNIEKGEWVEIKLKVV